ncbi:MAG: N-acetylglucosamine-6-phosphate deacetylase [Candidatus Omnitrophica bacterium]|nr:N-acetylglucosamine-6-phosphate deacetylase [Candidatus Omnitrophota bacterium]
MEGAGEPLALLRATAITPFRREENITLVLSGGQIAQMGKPEDVSIPAGIRQIDLKGNYVLPGFIDLHVHGGYGYDFCDDSPHALDKISSFHSRYGTTSLIATIYPQPEEPFLNKIKQIREYCESAPLHRIIEGIHAEGPFLNPEMHGAINPEWMWPATVENYHKIIDAGGSWVRVMTIAPEIPGAMDVLRVAALGKRKVTAPNNGRIYPIYLSIGHSKAPYEELAEAIDNGMEGVTHIFNAMPSIHHRKPGVLTGTLLRDELFVEVIADALHVHPAVLKLLMKVKTHDKILLVTDAIRAAGQPEGKYLFSSHEIEVRQGRAYISNCPETLAGSTLNMGKAVRTMVKLGGASLEQAAQMASLNAARVLQWKYRRGILAVGKDADLAIMDPDLHVNMTIKRGHIVWDRENAA